SGPSTSSSTASRYRLELWFGTKFAHSDWLIPQRPVHILLPGRPAATVRAPTGVGWFMWPIEGDKTMETTVLGYPRIGAQRELEQATEAFLAGLETTAALTGTAAALRRQAWEALREAGLS